MEINDDGYNDLLGICLTDASKLPYILNKIKVDEFPKGVYRIIYQAISDLYSLGLDVDIVTVSNRLLNTNKLKEIGGRNVINKLAIEAPMSFMSNKIIESVIAQNTYRKMVTLVAEFKEEVDKTDNLLTTSMDYCNKISNLISGNQVENKIETISTGADEVITDLYRTKENGCLGIKTGFPSLDYYTGGLQKGKIYIIGARPSMGKSSYAMNIAEYVAQEHNVLFISLEMSKKEYAQRLMFSRAGVDVNTVNTGRISEEEIEKVSEQKEYLDSLNLFIETRTPCKVSDIELAIINLQSTRGSCDLVVVDYLQLLTPSHKSKSNREVEVAEMSRDLKSIAIKYQIPIIVLSQLSRALETRQDKRPMMSDLRESGAIEQDADVITFLYRNEYYEPEDPSSRGMAELLIRKNRGGTNNKDIELCWQPNKVKFTEAITNVL